MRYHALACDYDGTLARNGLAEPSTLQALQRVRASGRKLLLVTGRGIDDLQSVCSQLELFDCVIAENGALLYDPRSQRERVLAEAPPAAFIEALRRRYVPVSVGRVIVATWEPHERAVLETIRDLGLELHVIFNKGAVMVLPAGVSKASGLAAALLELGLSPHNVVGVGDAENDHAFLAACECAVAVANALPTIRERADVVTEGEAGAGVAQLADELVATDLVPWEPRLLRHWVTLGKRLLAGGGEADALIPPYGSTILIAGSSGGGKSTLAIGLLERLMERGYQWSAIDPEGVLASTIPPAPHTALTGERPGGLVIVTVALRSVASSLLREVTVGAFVGEGAVGAVAELAAALGEPMPEVPAGAPAEGQALVWDRRSGEPPFLIEVVPGAAERERQLRRYAEGELGPDRSFYFRGPDGALNLRAQNLITFNQIAEGVDDRAWLFHLRRGDYSTWFRDQIKDQELAEEVASVEHAESMTPSRSRELVRDAIEKRYTAPV